LSGSNPPLWSPRELKLLQCFPFDSPAGVLPASTSPTQSPLSAFLEGGWWRCKNTYLLRCCISQPGIHPVKIKCKQETTRDAFGCFSKRFYVCVCVWRQNQTKSTNKIPNQSSPGSAVAAWIVWSNPTATSHRCPCSVLPSAASRSLASGVKLQEMVCKFLSSPHICCSHPTLEPGP
jgi:hypothetical protein